jgi:hypothetical protein
LNHKVYIHEFIDIIGHNRARYMHHMTANWSPMSQEDRGQRCYGVWGVVGSTRRWPEVVNIWEENDFESLARSFRAELSHPDLQDPKLAAWWAEAASMRSGGFDRLLIPAPWMPTIDEACAAGIRGELYAHEHVRVPRGSSAEYLEIVRKEAVPELGRFGWILVGAWRTALTDDSECFLLWAIPTWGQWGDYESAVASDPPRVDWQARHLEVSSSFERFLMVDAPLSPFRTGRQPQRSDRLEAWDG